MRVSGENANALLTQHFHSERPVRERYVTYGKIVDENGVVIDTGIAIFSRGPHSYTGEDTLELHVHGSPVIAQEVMRALIASGAQVAQPGEFTQRAFLNGKLDLHSAESVADLIAAGSRSAARAALANLGGGLTNEVRAVRARLTETLEELAAAIDFPDEVQEPPRDRLIERIDALVAKLEQLRRDGEVGRIVREGVSVAIVGPPNAGKSSLLNALLGEERAIVSDIPGTTRDTIEETIGVDGVLVRLVDTAGIRAHADRLEAAGITRAQHALASARIALVVLDGSQPLSGEASTLLEATRECECIVFVNKSDLGNIVGEAIHKRCANELHSDHRVRTSCIEGTVFSKETLDQLRHAIAEHGWNGTLPDLERPHLASAREFEAVHQALTSLTLAREILERSEPVDLIASEFQRAYIALGHITGDTATEELLTGIFARFCIGK